VKKVEEGSTIKFLYLQPVLIYTNKEIRSNSDLRKTTFESLGIRGGNILLRLVHRKTNVNAGEFFYEDDKIAIEDLKFIKKTNKKMKSLLLKISSLLRKLVRR